MASASVVLRNDAGGGNCDVDSGKYLLPPQAPVFLTEKRESVRILGTSAKSERGAFTEKPVVPVRINPLFRLEIKWNGPFHWKFFEKYRILSEVLLFLVFTKMTGKFSTIC